MNAARHLADLAADLTSRNASGERTLKVWGHRRGLSLPEVRRLVGQLVDQGLLVEGEGVGGGPVWRPVERTKHDLPPLEIETGEGSFTRCSVCGRGLEDPGRCAFCHELGYEEPEPSPTPPPASVERAAEAPPQAPSFEVEKEEVPVAVAVEEPAFAEEKASAEPETPLVTVAVEEEPILVAGAVEPCRKCEDLQWEMRKLREENNRLFVSYDPRRPPLIERLSGELMQARETSADIMAEVAESLDLDPETPWPSVIDRIRLLVAGAKARAEEHHPPAPSPRSLFAGLAPEARRNVADVLQELANHLRQEPTPSGKIGRGLDRLSSNARTVLDILPRGEEPSITRKEIKARSGLDNTNSVSTALRTLERLGLATSPSWGFWRAV